MVTYKVGYFVGSLSSTSINRLLAKALVKLAPPELVLTEIVIKRKFLLSVVTSVARKCLYFLMISSHQRFFLA
jgi:NAD(P)H-dependent FMN reductase